MATGQEITLLKRVIRLAMRLAEIDRRPLRGADVQMAFGVLAPDMIGWGKEEAVKEAAEFTNWAALWLP